MKHKLILTLILILSILILINNYCSGEISLNLAWEEIKQTKELQDYKEEINPIDLTIEKEYKQNSIIYKSKNEYIKEYAVYAFAFFCLLVIICIIKRKNGFPN
ncbi:hypothetical protein FJZ17_02715 [Candidatus Pacearchaeota archaeon]|nr:hypothetical protein [Candidatus Pacearchaeota archaeon]